ncbi:MULTISPECIES: hypothetical protein [Dickeya]|uniref:Uncharacterized protein n=1 Tax=Dickeya aquatica TaxID=1401087 RepID=A0A375AA30_9GAMM|nr:MULTISPECIES: hypothetical protein [Dickeya]SLM62791.1 hypothetical protein DAQ1742_01854 [Dickeya aquatica]
MIKYLSINQAPKEIRQALSHVREFIPEINLVHVKKGTVDFLCSDKKHPNLSKWNLVNTTIIEDASFEALHIPESLFYWEQGVGKRKITTLEIVLSGIIHAPENWERVIIYPHRICWRLGYGSGHETRPVSPFLIGKHLDDAGIEITDLGQEFTRLEYTQMALNRYQALNDMHERIQRKYL